MSCTLSTDAPDYNWIKVEINKTKSGNITFYGRTPRDNNYAGLYELTCELFDEFKDFVNTYVYKLVVLAK